MRAQRRSVRIAPTNQTIAPATTIVVRTIAVRASGTSKIVTFHLFYNAPNNLLTLCLLQFAHDQNISRANRFNYHSAVFERPRCSTLPDLATRTKTAVFRSDTFCWYL